MLSPVVKEYARRQRFEYKQLLSLIKKYDRIAIFRHIKPDYDALGSQYGLSTFIKDNFPNKEVKCFGDNHVTFTPRLFPESDRENDTWFDKPFLSIVVDVGDEPRIADPRFAKGSYIVKIDHHPCKKDIANLSFLDTSLSAAAEYVASILLSFKKYKISKECASYLYIGIVGDSGRFMYSSTSKHTFAIAEALLDCDIKISDIYLNMYEKKLDDLKVTAYILNNFSVSPHGVAYYVIPEDLQTKLNITSERVKENVNLFSNIEGVNAWCSFAEDNNPKDYCWRISIRSKKKDISGVAQKWEGGGHAQASGAKIKSLDDLPSFIKDLDDLFA